jgi:hypothetical protein
MGRQNILKLLHRDWLSTITALDDIGKRQILRIPGLELRPLSSPARGKSLNVQRHPG